MKKIIIISLLVFFTMSPVLGQSVSENLKPLMPFLGKTWTGLLMSPDGKNGFKVNLKYEVMWNGEAIRYTRENLDMEKSGIGYFYWNDIEKKIALFSLEDGGVFSEGFVRTERDTIFIEGKMTWPRQMNPSVKQQYDFKNNFEFTKDGQMIDRWFMNAFGPWRPGHVIEFKPQN